MGAGASVSRATRATATAADRSKWSGPGLCWPSLRLSSPNLPEDDQSPLFLPHIHSKHPLFTTCGGDSLTVGPQLHLLLLDPLFDVRVHLPQKLVLLVKALDLGHLLLNLPDAFDAHLFGLDAVHQSLELAIGLLVEVLGLAVLLLDPFLLVEHPGSPMPYSWTFSTSFSS